MRRLVCHTSPGLLRIRNNTAGMSWSYLSLISSYIRPRVLCSSNVFWPRIFILLQMHVELAESLGRMCSKTSEISLFWRSVKLTIVATILSHIRGRQSSDLFYWLFIMIWSWTFKIRNCILFNVRQVVTLLSTRRAHLFGLIVIFEPRLVHCGCPLSQLHLP